MPETLNNSNGALFSGAFFENFLAISRYETILSLAVLAFAFFIIYQLQKRKSSFFIRMLAGLILGAVIGLGVQALEGFPDGSTVVLKETSTWYGLFGRTFIAFIRMLVIPLVFVSIVKVILDFGGDKQLSKVTRRGIFWLLFTTGIAAILGMILASIMGLGKSDEVIQTSATIREYTTLVDTFVNLVPNNIISAMNNNNIIGLVIFSALVGIAANRMQSKTPEAMNIFRQFIEALHKIVMSITMTVIKYMPYAVVALLAGTIISNGIPAVKKVSSFVLAICIASSHHYCRAWFIANDVPQKITRYFSNGIFKPFISGNITFNDFHINGAHGRLWRNRKPYSFPWHHNGHEWLCRLLPSITGDDGGTYDRH